MAEATPATPAAPPAPPPPPPPPPTPSAEDQLGDPGKRALQAERDARAAAEREAKTAKEELAKLQNATKTEHERALDAARKEGHTEALKKAAPLVVRLAAEAEAATKLADPDAVAMLGDLNRFVGDDGSVDRKGLSSAIDELVKEKPYLAAGPGKGAGEGGPRGGATPPAGAEDPLTKALKEKLGIPD